MFVPLLEPPGAPEQASLVIAVRGNRVRLADGEPAAPGIFLGMLSGRHCWALDADDHGGDHHFTDLRTLWGSVDEATWMIAGRAVQLVE